MRDCPLDTVINSIHADFSSINFCIYLFETKKGARTTTRKSFLIFIAMDFRLLFIN